MIFRPETKLYAYEITREGGQDVMYINYLGHPSVPNIADSSMIMARTLDGIIENTRISKIVFVQQRNYVYDFNQTNMLVEIAQLYTFLTQQEKVLSPKKLVPFGDTQFLQQRYNAMRWLILTLLKQDPISCYVEAKRLLREEKINAERIAAEYVHSENAYVRLLNKIVELLEGTRLIKEARDVDIVSHKIGEREIYRKFFRPDVVPNFTFTRLMASLPAGADVLDEYKLESGYDKSLVTILKIPGSARPIYHLQSPEFMLEEDFYSLIDLARSVLIEHRPKAEEFTDPQRTRQVFFNISRDLLRELAASKKINLSYRQLNKLAAILVRHTIGFGLIEILLQDEKLQDIFVNAPISSSPIFVRHQDFDECATNIIPAFEDADAWAARFRLISGRPLDEANPVLDTDLNIDEIRARVAVIQQPLSSSGLAYALRRHREKPWTLPLFIKNRMLNPLAAGLLSFLVDGARTLLVAGTRSAGKTSLLAALMLEIMQKNRIIVIEDSVTGDSKIIVKENGKFKKTTIGEFIDERIKKKGFSDADGREKDLNPDGIELFAVDREGKIVLAKPSKLIRHRTNKEIYEVTTFSGKKIKVTEDHSLFTLDEKSILKPIKSREIKENSFIAIPLILPFDNSCKSINLLEHIDKFKKKVFVHGEPVNKYIIENRRALFSLAHSLSYNKLTIQNWIKKKILPFKIFNKIKSHLDEEKCFIKSMGPSGSISSKIMLDETFLNFVGLWLADGCYDKNSVIVSVQEEENKEVVRKIAQRFNIPVKTHSDKFSSMLNSSLLKEAMQNALELKGDSYTKKMPQWAYNLSKEQIGWLLKGYFSGDGCVSSNEIVSASCSNELVRDLEILLLRFGIVLRISEMRQRDKTFQCRVSSVKMANLFKENIGFLVKAKRERLEKLCLKSYTHDIADIIPISLEVKEELGDILGAKFNKHDYITRQNDIGREHLSNLLESVPKNVTNPIDPLKKIVKADIFWDRVKSIKKFNSKEFVYDISVPGCENFICENIIAHNTLEMPVNSFKRLGYDILRMKVRSALLRESTEMDAADGIRTSLRLGDSSLIVGEVRSEEAKALYEAMRIGALANVVAGTIHGGSPYAVFDRVVNDLGVPITSFKATDLVLVANPIKSPDGIHSFRRVTQMSEVRKNWTKDPLEEKGFVDLMNYEVKKDSLEPSADLINGDSEIIKAVAGQVRGWAGNWDAVWDNILLRANIKSELVEKSAISGMKDMLEAPFIIRSNNMFHEISEKISKEVGIPEGKRVFAEWKDWLNDEIRRRTL